MDALVRRLPRSDAKVISDLWAAHMDARRNCEGLAFRGHRLLQQMQVGHKTSRVHCAMQSAPARARSSAACWPMRARVQPRVCLGSCQGIMCCRDERRPHMATCTNKSRRRCS